MRIVIIGTGVAGLTLAALLRQRGITPVLVERSEHIAAGGNMLGLDPIWGRVPRRRPSERRRRAARPQQRERDRAALCGRHPPRTARRRT